MSNLAYAQPRTAPAVHPRHIEIASTREQRKARPRAVYAVVTVASLFVIFAAQLLLSIVVSDGAYQISSLQGQQKELLRQQDALSEHLYLLDSTQNLAANAASLGMVPNGKPRAIDLGSGEVFKLPGSADPTGCGGSCGLITNDLLKDVPLVDKTGTADAAATGNAEAATSTEQTSTQTGDDTAVASTPAATDALPAPITH